METIALSTENAKVIIYQFAMGIPPTEGDGRHWEQDIWTSLFSLMQLMFPDTVSG